MALHNVSSQNSLQKDVLETKVIKRGPQKPMQLLHAFWDMLNGLAYTKLGNQHLIDFLRQKGWRMHWKKHLAHSLNLFKQHNILANARYFDL